LYAFYRSLCDRKIISFLRPRPNFARRPNRRAKIGGEFEGRKIFARLPKRSPAALLVQSRVPQKSFLFLLEEKEIAHQIKECEENFFAGYERKRGGGADQPFRSKKVRAKCKISPPRITFRKIKVGSLGFLPARRSEVSGRNAGGIRTGGFRKFGGIEKRIGK